MQHTLAQNQPQPGDPKKSLRDRIISFLLDAIVIAQFFGITGEDVTNWIIKVITWLFHQGVWLYHITAPVLKPVVNELLRLFN
ncbi:hypothetical protein [Dyadobacter bucti]|uniref:hypothetical protein n=1 Tax=Dyadobacter bucti TaxID=2572203 RepID=UPI001108BDB7|nr:hypothetical protein [Dyadobacter bucti]